MKNIQKVGTRNQLKFDAVHRYNLSDMISESYKLLFDCEVDSKLYKLVECHINNVRENPEKLDSLSRDLSVLKGLRKLGESAVIKESDIPQDTEEFTDDMGMSQKNLGSDSDVEEMDNADVINEDEELEVSDEEEIIEENEEEEEDLLEDEVAEEETMEESDEEEVPAEEIEEDENQDDLTQEELQELKKHLKEMRRARKVSEAKQVKAVKESRTWAAEKSSMKAALKHFSESSKNKAFYRTFSKMSGRLNSKNPLTLAESILLYKAANSAMTQLTVELEHNPGFIYTFKECTDILSKDTTSLLECIRGHKTPSHSLVESLRHFSQILLESEEENFDDEYEETPVEEQEEIVDTEEEITETEETEEIESPVEEQEEISDEEVVEESEDEEVLDPEEVEESEEISDEESEEITEESDEITSEEISGEEIEAPSEDLEEDDSEITDEEAEELRKKLEEIRQNKRSRK